MKTWLKSKNPASEAVCREERDEEWRQSSRACVHKRTPGLVTALFANDLRLGVTKGQKVC